MTASHRPFLPASLGAGFLAVLEIAPRAPRFGRNSVYMLEFAARTPHLGKHQENYAVSRQAETWFAPAPEVRKGVLTVPQGPGLGVTALPAILRMAKRVVPGRSTPPAGAAASRV